MGVPNAPPPLPQQHNIAHTRARALLFCDLSSSTNNTNNTNNNNNNNNNNNQTVAVCFCLPAVSLSSQYAPLPGSNVAAATTPLVVAASTPTPAAPAGPIATTADVSADAFAGVSEAQHVEALRTLYAEVAPEKLSQVWMRGGGGPRIWCPLSMKQGMGGGAGQKRKAHRAVCAVLDLN